MESPSPSRAAAQAPASILLPPTFGHVGPDGRPYRPSLREVLREWLDAVDVRHPARRLPAMYAAYHLATGIAGAASFINFRWDAFVFGLAGGLFISFVYHTLWYHRYCSHASFRFSSPWFARVLLWTNPLAYREEMYAIPHRVHHERSDQPGDPYGPHLGWLGSYLATESQQKLDTSIDGRRYAALVRSLSHIGFPANSHAAFRRTGSVEPAWHYLARFAVAQTLWFGFSYAVGGWKYFFSWSATVFIFSFFMRDFPWRGHGGNFRTTKIEGWEFDRRSRSINTPVFGVLGGEWHDNHHLLPASANTAFLPGQVDVPFLIVKLWRRLGIVSGYYDAAGVFAGRYLTAGSEAEAPAGGTDDDLAGAGRGLPGSVGQTATR
jgi:sn-1 stearoyl-lipid 9-desaturase